MVHCTQCGAAAPEGANYCPKCGSALPAEEAVQSAAEPAVPTPEPEAQGDKPRDKTVVVGLVVVAALVILVMILRNAGDSPPSGPAESNAISAAENASRAADEAMNAAMNAADAAAGSPHSGGSGAGSRWSYTTSTDAMTDKTASFAQLSSDNEIQQGSPYGSSGLSVTVRKHPRMGTDVYFTLGSGQLLCPSYDGCSALIRFDDGAPQRYRMLGASDNSSDVVFAANAGSLLSKLKAAKRMVVSLEVYQAGNPNFEFNVAALTWPPAAK